MTKKNRETKPNYLLRQAREQRGWSQERLAQELEVSPQTVSRWERGTAFPYPHFREQLSLLFGKSIEALGLVLERTDDRPGDISNQPSSQTTAASFASQSSLPYNQARREHAWSEKNVAEKIGADQKTMSRWEERSAYPSPYFRQKLAEADEKEFTSNVSPISTLATGAFEETAKLFDGFVDDSGRPLAANRPSGQHALAIAMRSQNRRRMLGRLRRAYSELLEHSLQEIVWIELGLAEMPNAVQNATNRLVRLSQQDDQPLPSGTSILEVYETSERELLILGEPGAGKSTMLLHLAQILVQRAEQEETHPLPVILRLSSWAEQQPALEDWMSDQLALTYNVSRKLSAQWVRDEQVLPLLDGLDEMDAASRSACINVLNAYHREHLLVPLVICSRRAEYEDAARRQKLALQRAVLIQPLTLEQVSASLDQIGQPLDILRQTLQVNPALQELTTTPLMLSILMLTYTRTPVPLLSHEISTLQRQVWTDYVARMIEQKGDARRYPLQQTCSWLSWLACNLRKHYQTVFYLEHMELDWLPGNLRQRALWLTMRLPIILLGVLSSLIIGLFLQTVFDLTTGVQAAAMGGLLAGCLSQSASVSTEVSTFSATQTRRRRYNLGRGLVGAGAGLVLGLSFGFELDPGYGPGDWLRDGLLYGSIIGLICWLLLVLLPLFSSPRVSHAPAHLLFTLHLWRTLPGAIGLGLAYGLSTGLSYGLSYGPSAGLNIMLSYGCTIFLISLIVEKNKRDIRLTERLRWSWSSFLHRLRDFQHCITSGVLALGLLLVVGLSYGLTTGLGLQLSASLGFRLSYGLSDGLSDGLSTGPGAGLTDGLTMGLIVGVGIGLGYWLGLGLFQSIAQEQIEDQDRQSLNQGVRRSALNSIIIGLLSGALIGSLGFLGYGLSYWVNEGLSTGLNVGLSGGLGYALSAMWLFAIGGGLFGWAISGGWAVLRHFVLRWLLHRGHVFPWHAQGFLNNATTRILLQRVGGGYSFIHRLLLEYFANLDDETIDNLGRAARRTKQDR
ncbi:MAG TPA: helix-turn-helix domain-containing protein [Ktedonobacteraceae bacterium]|nr:helix-turn-helix domain-containing protein [Ktedonobacteraceae bacterium]